MSMIENMQAQIKHLKEDTENTLRYLKEYRERIATLTESLEGARMTAKGTLEAYDLLRQQNKELVDFLEEYMRMARHEHFGFCRACNLLTKIKAGAV